MGNMYSPFYYYFNICKDRELSQTASTDALIDFMTSMPELMQHSAYGFRNSGQFPYWLRISLFNAKSYDSYNGDTDADSVHTNILVVVATRDEEGQILIQSLLEKISNWLNWQVINEDDENNEG